MFYNIGTRSVNILKNIGGKTISDASQCLTDTFSVSSSIGVVPNVCGTLTNDHSE
jgi:hypothetical protein